MNQIPMGIYTAEKLLKFLEEMTGCTYTPTRGVPVLSIALHSTIFESRILAFESGHCIMVLLPHSEVKSGLPVYDLEKVRNLLCNEKGYYAER